MPAPIPERIIQAVQRRVEDSARDRISALNKIEIDRPLDAEPNQSRKIQRIERVTGLMRHDAGLIANYSVLPENFDLQNDSLRNAERILGVSADFVGVAFLDLARIAARTVGRVTQSNGSPWGSGFLVSNRLFLTNNHVIARAEQASSMFVEFEYELDRSGQPKQITRFQFAPEEFFFTNGEDDLDFTLIAIGERILGPRSLSDLGFCPLSDSPDRHTIGEYVNIVQHPEGRFKELVLRENRIVWRSDNVLHYVADTEPGSSGSPVFNDQWEPVALHHWGGPHRDLTDKAGRRLNQEINEGLRISAIVRELQRSQASGNASPLLRDAISTWNRSDSMPSGRIDESTVDKRSSPPSSYMAPQVSSDGIATWTIPLTVSVALGQQSKPQAIQEPTYTSKSNSSTRSTTSSRLVDVQEAARVDENYDNRKGYDPNFLNGFVILLPSVASRLSPAPRIDSPSADKRFVLDYEHFSIVVNKRRRMAIFTAVNIDGPKSKRVDRKTGKVKEDAEGGEVWFRDPRIAEEHQCEQSLYSNQQPRLFDRGHLVRREDPNWGKNNIAERANADTFHFSNCTPQVSQFNQRAEFWQGIENYILDNARADGERVIVFTGPVFDSSDPQYRYVKVPKQFWKICVRVDAGRLWVLAMLADQSSMLSRLPEHGGKIDEHRVSKESFKDMEDISQFQTTVAEIERLTGLDFGELRDHDVQVDNGESLRKRDVKSFEDIKLGKLETEAKRQKRK